MTTLFTVGYQGHSIETFLDLVQAHGVAHIIDVRERPFSRKPDFSKKRFSARLADAGIGYTHLVALGTPKPLRDEVRRTHDFPTFFAEMDALMAAQPEALHAALELARAQPAAVLCFEAKPEECHRMSVVRAMQSAAAEPLEIIHL
ncbi:hypothetical protein SE17_35760 [Kouleothrix aurantiaca]|uniref:DUF488 domain-containing protein n=1 Tax=Kouleothrix aurantiaca TaxID=186479 RepID=A0A0P9F8W9_9CHLR|nr:hypothetical protein SE17_35760 [Kouleothrix aurantiaca]